MVSKVILLGGAGAVAAGALAIILFSMSGGQEPAPAMQQDAEQPAQQEMDPTIQRLMESPPAPPEVEAMLLDLGYTPLGYDDAPITLVEFGDYQCHFCHQFFENTEEDIISNYVETGLVKLVFRDFTIIGPDSTTAAHGAQCAEEQGLFWEYHVSVYSNWDGENTGWASMDRLRQYAADAGLDMQMWDICMELGEYYSNVAASTQDARDLGIGGTPAFFVIAPNGAVLRVPGAQPYEVFQNVFDGIAAAIP